MRLNNRLPEPFAVKAPQEKTPAALIISCLALAVSILQMMSTSQNIGEMSDEIATQNRKVDSYQSMILDMVTKREVKEVIRNGIEATIDNNKQKEIARTFREFSAADEFIEDGTHRYGKKDAIISLIEFSDFQCPFCNQFHNTPKHIVDSSKGRINWEYNHFPIDVENKHSMQQANASECVAEISGNRAFWAFSERVFSYNPKTMPDYIAHGMAVGVPEESYRTCMEQNRHVLKVLKSQQRGISFGINTTPTTIIRNNRSGEQVLLPGKQDTDVIIAYIQQLLDVEQ